VLAAIVVVDNGDALALQRLLVLGQGHAHSNCKHVSRLREPLALLDDFSRLEERHNAPAPRR